MKKPHVTKLNGRWREIWPDGIVFERLTPYRSGVEHAHFRNEVSNPGGADTPKSDH